MELINVNVSAVYGGFRPDPKCMVNNLIHPESAQVLADIRFSISERDTIFVAGPAGIGKSTLLTLLRANPRYKGKVKKSDKLKVRCISQQLTIDTQETVRNALLFDIQSNEEYYGDPKKTDEKLDYWLKAFNLSNRAEFRINALSGGQQRRAMLAERFAADEDYSLLIADEPDTGLDIRSQLNLHQLMVNNAEKEGKALITVSHNVFYSNVRLYKKIMLLGRSENGIATIRYFDSPEYLENAFGTKKFLEIFEQLEDPTIKKRSPYGNSER